MKHWYISWNENVAYESEFYTEAEKESPEWFDALEKARQWCDSNGWENVNIELLDD